MSNGEIEPKINFGKKVHVKIWGYKRTKFIHKYLQIKWNKLHELKNTKHCSSQSFVSLRKTEVL